ncbi:MAG TPA: LCP family protein [Acetivibrio sp.]|nr:LCP family protein [Clostridium sp.]HOQ37369.1 LCP family protein [Acetivibrio sp.]HPT91348.1 LCP family protein [Acetivibrio sp.]HQA58571.1 LCP family protein [Acetivibrio sp.]
MKLRKVVFYICTVFSLILFIQGVYFLLFSGEEGNSTDFRSKYSPIQIIRKNTYDDSYRKKNSCVNLLLMGLDEEETRADVIILLNYSHEKGIINVLSIARDTRVKVDGKAMKINALISKGGEKAVIDMVENMVGLNIDYYMTLNFKAFRKIVDTLGGVKIDVPFDMDYDDPYQNLHIHLKKGERVLNGREAEGFVRYRKGNEGQGYENGDIGRIEMQHKFISEFIKQKFKMKYLLKADDIFYILKENMKTNVEIGDLRYFIRDLDNLKVPEIKCYTLPGDSKYIDNQWYYIYDRKETERIIEDNFFISRDF